MGPAEAPGPLEPVAVAGVVWVSLGTARVDLVAVRIAPCMVINIAVNIY